MINKSIVKLKLSDVAQLQSKINEINVEFGLSAINLYIWSHYGLIIYYALDENAIYLYLLREFNDGFNEKRIAILRPIIKKEHEKNIQDYYKNSINLLRNTVWFDNDLSKLMFSTTNQNDFKLFHQVSLIGTFNYSYLYLTNQLKYMIGKKMQKKRNFVNVFKKNYENFAELKKYDESQKNDVIEFCMSQSVDENNNVRTNEIDAAKDLLSINSKNGYGSVLYYKKEIIGFTYGIIVNNRYEIFIEKANKNYKGSYQYLILKNLQVHDINTLYVDRQDDMYNENLKKSKQSYKPISVPKFFFFGIERKNN